MREVKLRYRIHRTYLHDTEEVPYTPYTYEDQEVAHYKAELLNKIYGDVYLHTVEEIEINPEEEES
jgi:hypothetical protein